MDREWKQFNVEQITREDKAALGVEGVGDEIVEVVVRFIER